MMTRVSDGQQVIIQNGSFDISGALDGADGSSDNTVDFDAIFQVGLDNNNPSINEVVSTQDYTFMNVGGEAGFNGSVIMTRVSDGQQVIIQNTSFRVSSVLDGIDGSSDNSVDLDAIFQVGLDQNNPNINEMTGGILIVCFARGTLIKAHRGEVPIEELKVGDKVLTVDAGYQPIRWMGMNKLSKADLDANPKLKPIRIRADALGPGMPKQDLLVSPNTGCWCAARWRSACLASEKS